MTVGTVLLHLCTPGEWRRWLDTGAVAPPSLDEVGFVHLSTPDQVALPAQRLFAGRSDPGPRQSRDGWVLSCGDVGGGGGCGHRLGVIMRVSNPCSRQEACVRSVSVSDRCCSGRPGGRS
ncbi:DUF952 domain-containing protein [Pseudonocardia sp. ICBG1142]|uniref:DUF952 domain-containing protein n=1 Tax=Pseudonocardia sp. ICBG1142 TaxID=2846760 RepID=UPI001CF67E00|nr:DUF952 domain-containing protein [Pseudonocardia sp. ICBG1142]